MKTVSINVIETVFYIYVNHTLYEFLENVSFPYLSF